KSFNGFARKGLVHAFDLLQAGDVRLALAEPGQEVVEALAHRIDVPGGDSHRWHGLFKMVTARTVQLAAKSQPEQSRPSIEYTGLCGSGIGKAAGSLIDSSTRMFLHESPAGQNGFDRGKAGALPLCSRRPKNCVPDGWG